MKKLLVSVLAVLALATPAWALNPASLRNAAEYSAARHGYSFLIVEKGQVTFEDYRNGAKSNTPSEIFSGTKAFWVLATLAAAGDGLLSLDEPAARTITEWASDPQRSRITLRDLMSCTSGLEPLSWIQRRGMGDINTPALRAKMVAAPRKAFTYGPSHYQVLCEILKRKLKSRGTTPVAYLRAKILTPLEIPSIKYREDLIGNPLFATSFELAARQWAKVGLLVLQHGSYNGHQIVPAGLLAECFRGSAANREFGLGFWLNVNAGKFGARERDVEEVLKPAWNQENWRGLVICHAAPSDLVVSLGSSYQRLFIIPSENAIIVRQGDTPRFSDSAFLRLALHP